MEFFNNSPVVFLERGDFVNGVLTDSSGRAVNAIIMIMTTRCPHCIQSAPNFKEFAKQLGTTSSYVACVIVVNQDQSLVKYLTDNRLIPPIPGVPMFVRFRNGRFDSELRTRQVRDWLQATQA